MRPAGSEIGGERGEVGDAALHNTRNSTSEEATAAGLGEPSLITQQRSEVRRVPTSRDP